MKNLFKPFSLGPLDFANRFVFPPVKLGRGNPDGRVTDSQLQFYRRIAQNGPAVVILEPVSVTPDGKEHPKQLCVHLPESAAELAKIVDVVHAQGRLACLHLNHAGAAANPKASGGMPRAPSSMTCPRSGEESEPLNEDGIRRIVEGFGAAAKKAAKAGFDLIEVQAGHGYLVSQFLNVKTNKRKDRYGEDRLLFAREVLASIGKAAPGLPVIARVSGSEMAPEVGITHEDLLPFLKLAEESGVIAIHVGMGNTCFSPPWYFHHGSLPMQPQTDALSWVRGHTPLPLIVAGRMGRKERVDEVMAGGLADLIALGRPLIADPDLIEKWREGKEDKGIYCGYCLQGCLHRMKSGEPLGCNLNPETGLPPMEKTAGPRKVLVVGGGPAGMSAALYMTRRGHKVTLVEKSDRLGGQFNHAWQVPGKEAMKDGLVGLQRAVEGCGAKILFNTAADMTVINRIQPDVMVWAVGALPKKPDIPGLGEQNAMTALEFFNGEKEVYGPRVLVIGAGRVGLELAEKLGKDGYQVVATKRTDPLGGTMEMITRKLALMRIGQLDGVTLMPKTTVKAFTGSSVELEQDGESISYPSFQTVILASGMVPAPGPDEEMRDRIPGIEIIGDAEEVRDIYTAVQAAYNLAQRY